MPLRVPLASLAAALLLALPAAAQWTTDAQLNTVVRDAAGTWEMSPLLATTPTGSTYVAWFEYQGTSYDMRLQLLDAAGHPQLGAAGLLVSSQAQGGAQYPYDLKVDGQGNALLAFHDNRTGGLHPVLYKISPTGQQLWGATGISLPDQGASSGHSPVIGLTAAGNVVVAWTSTGPLGAGEWVSYQKFSPAGAALWPAVQRVLSPSFTFRSAYLVAAGPDDVVLSYQEETRANGAVVSTIYAQRLDAAGAAVWPARVQVSSSRMQFRSIPAYAPDGSGGYYVLYTTSQPNAGTIAELKVQHLSAQGALWSPTGTQTLTIGAAERPAGARLLLVPQRNEVWALINMYGTSYYSGIVLQRLDLAGAAQLGPTGVSVQPVTPSQFTGVALRDAGNGLLLVYTERTSANYPRISALKLDYDAQPAWAAGPVPLADAPANKRNIGVGELRANQLVTVWEDARTDFGIYAQNLSADGQLGLVTAAPRPQAARPLTLYPNPGPAATLHLELPHAQTITLRLTDGAGRPVQQQHLRLPAGAQQLPLRADNLAPGFYLVEAEVAGGRLRATWLKQ